VCWKAVAAAPAGRYPWADAMRRALDRFARRPYAILARASGLLLLTILGLWVARGRSGAGPASPPTGPELPRFAPITREVPPSRILGLSIQHLAKQGEDRVVRRGDLGERSFVARPDDDVPVQADLSEPAYASLIAFRPDGVDEICDPEDPEARPRKTRRPRYPPAAETDKVYRLDNGPGLQA